MIGQDVKRGKYREGHLDNLGNVPRFQLSLGRTSLCPLPALCRPSLGPRSKLLEPVCPLCLPSHTPSLCRRGFLLRFNFSQLHTGLLICTTPGVETFVGILSQDTLNAFPVNCTSTGTADCGLAVAPTVADTSRLLGQNTMTKTT